MAGDCEAISQSIERQSPRKKRKLTPTTFNNTSNNNCNDNSNNTQNGRTGQISLREANKIIEYAIQTARKSNLLPTAVCVVDSRGTVKSSQCEDGCSPVQYKIAFGKARGKSEITEARSKIWSCIKSTKLIVVARLAQQVQ